MLSFVDVGHEGYYDRPTGCRPRETEFGSEFRTFADTDVEVIPRSQWKDLLEQNTSLEVLCSKVKDQGREGSCASNATVGAYELVWNMMLGARHWIEMSAMSVYRWVGSGPNSGSTIDGNLRQIRDTGILPTDSAENKTRLAELNLNTNHVHPNTGYYTRFPQGWEETAKYFRCFEWFEIGNFDELITCLFLDVPVVYGRAGHAICGVTPAFDNGKWYIRYLNSWSPQWGDGGFGHDSESYVSRSISSYGAWALRAVLLSEPFV